MIYMVFNKEGSSGGNFEDINVEMLLPFGESSAEDSVNGLSSSWQSGGK